MLQFKPIGYRVLAEHVEQRKTGAIELPDGTKMDGVHRWVVRALGDAMILVTGEKVEIYQVKEGDEIMFDPRRSVEAAPPCITGGKQFAIVDVEGIFCVVTGETDSITPPPPKIAIPRPRMKIAS